MVTKPVIERLDTEVAELKGRVRGAADYVALLNKDVELPSAPIFAFVIYGGLSPEGKPTVAVGDFRQPVRRGVKVVVFYRTHDPRGARRLDDIDELTEDIHAALCGWRPEEDTIGVFQAAGAQVSNFREGILAHQIDFTINDQLRFPK